MRALVPAAHADRLTHLVATGAVAVGDDLIQSVARAAAFLSRVSRRFENEGIVNVRSPRGWA